MKKNLSSTEIRSKIKTHYSDGFIDRVVEYHKKLADVNFVLFPLWIQRQIASEGSYSEDRRKTFLPILRKWAPLDNTMLIDIGCGLGNGSVVYALEGYEVIGVDITVDTVKIAQMRAKEDGAKCQFVVADARRLPFKDGVFDVCMCIELIEHVREGRKKVIRETCRVAKRKGIVEIETPNKLYPKDLHTTQLYLINYLPQRIAEAYARARRRILENGVDRYVTYSFVVKELGRCNCKILGGLLGDDFDGFKNRMQDYKASSRELGILASAIAKLCKIPSFGTAMRIAVIFAPLIIVTAKKV